jgi:hypothetical protein
MHCLITPIKYGAEPKELMSTDVWLQAGDHPLISHLTVVCMHARATPAMHTGPRPNYYHQSAPPVMIWYELGQLNAGIKLRVDVVPAHTGRVLGHPVH